MQGLHSHALRGPPGGNTATVQPGGSGSRTIPFRTREASQTNVFKEPAANPVMVERDIHAERREALANSTLEGNRSDLIQFHLDLAKKFGSGSIPREMRDQEAASTALVPAGRLLELKKIEYARGVKNKMPDQEVNASILRLGTAMFLIDRVTEIRDAALKKNNLGIYALYSSLRDDVCRLLGPSYYSMPFKDIAGEYIIFEPSIAVS